MKIGVVFPQTEFGDDPVAIREYAQRAEELGYSHVLAYDHVLGADPETYRPWKGPYTYTDPFIEPFVLFSFMAAVTTRLEFITGILILPQRQTALVAKQAATLDVLSRGRFRLGVGIGWNDVEYRALGQDFHNRGRRVEEQVALLRHLWSEPLVTFSGRWHDIARVGLNPLPIQQPIPIWFGGRADAVLKRVAEIGDGWLPTYATVEQARPSLDKLAGYLEQSGREMADIGMEPRLAYGDADTERWREIRAGWEAAGATHLSVNTMRCGLEGPGAHMEAIRHFAEEMDLT